MKVAVLALQGAFIEHIRMLNSLGVECIELRQKADLKKPYDALILPGGESTVQGKLLHELDMFNLLQKQITSGMPVLGTCAGLILLANKLSNDEHYYLQTLPVTVKRNAYGRQLGSFFTKENFGALGKIPMKFIRAPYIENVGTDVEILAKVNNNIVGVKYKNQIGITFHPELCENTKIHEMLLKLIT